MNHPLLCTGNVTSLIGLMQTCSRQFVRMALLNIITKLTVLAATQSVGASMDPLSLSSGPNCPSSPLASFEELQNSWA